MPKFFKIFIQITEEPWGSKDSMDDIVNNLFYKYDANRNGFLDKYETIRMINEILSS